MAVDKATQRLRHDRDVLDRLIRRKGLARYGLFFVTAEGKELPDGSESGSGFAISADGRVYFFWIDWDHKAGRPYLETWEEVPIEEHWATNREYQLARVAAGLR
jgi:hypothetical protein